MDLLTLTDQASVPCVALAVIDLDSSVAELNLPTRARHCLANASIGTVGALVAMTEERLLRLPHFGRVSLRAVEAALAAFGLALAAEPTARPP